MGGPDVSGNPEHPGEPDCAENIWLQNGGGEGSRTPVPCALTGGFYMLSFVFVVVMASRQGALYHFQVF